MASIKHNADSALSDSGQHKRFLDSYAISCATDVNIVPLKGFSPCRLPSTLRRQLFNVFRRMKSEDLES